jgi:hypothetical protein
MALESFLQTDNLLGFIIFLLGLLNISANKNRKATKKGNSLMRRILLIKKYNETKLNRLASKLKVDVEDLNNAMNLELENGEFDYD